VLSKHVVSNGLYPCWYFAKRSADNVFSDETTSKMLVELMENLNLEAGPETSTFPKMLDAIAETNPEKLLPFVESSHGKTLASKLLALSNSPDSETSNAAVRLRRAVDAAVSGSSGDSAERLLEVTADNICTNVREPMSEHLS
jgi:hypothetical protein